MYLSYYGLEKNLFQKEINANEAFKSIVLQMLLLGYSI